MNRRQANQVRGKINQYAREQAFLAGTVTVEVNPYGTRKSRSRCDQLGERFSNPRWKPHQGEMEQAVLVSTRKVVQLSLVQRGHAPARMLSPVLAGTVPESIASWNAAGTPGPLD